MKRVKKLLVHLLALIMYHVCHRISEQLLQFHLERDVLMRSVIHFYHNFIKFLIENIPFFFNIFKGGGGRTSWEKEWFSTSRPFVHKTDYNRDVAWPAPNSHRIPPSLGHDTATTYRRYPVHTMGRRLNTNIQLNKLLSTTHDFIPPLQGKNSEIALVPSTSTVDDISISNDLKQTTPSPLPPSQELISLEKLYYRQLKKAQEIQFPDVLNSLNHTKRTAPKIQMHARLKTLTDANNKSINDTTPGPGAYNHNNFKKNSKKAPIFSVPHASVPFNPNSAYLGPFSVL
jgi:hypothetical protein